MGLPLPSGSATSQTHFVEVLSQQLFQVAVATTAEESAADRRGDLPVAAVIQGAARDVEGRRQILAGGDNRPVGSPKIDVEGELEAGEVAIGAGNRELTAI